MDVRYLMWLLQAALFFSLFAFALNNQEPVVLRLFFGATWQAPLVLVLLCVLVFGVFLGVIVMLPLWLRARKLTRTTVASLLTDAHPSLSERRMPPSETLRHGP